ncbi:unnamed protein product [Prorocentrum cordatum]|uniref:Transmembrane protein n=1 Tax=Prorocentrum cordatum TaxID=2364126 RepID=A0ABN9Y5D4_9DINO|nr:unnamed protein product [Polarella glacialis]
MGLLPHVSTYSIGTAGQNAVFISSLLGLVASAAFVFHTVVYRFLARRFWKAITSRLKCSDIAMQEEVTKKFRTEGLHHACCINFFFSMWCCVNLTMMVVNTVLRTPRWMTVWQDVLWVVLTFACISSQLALRRWQHHSTVNVVYVVSSICNTAFVSVGPSGQVAFLAIAACSMFIRGAWGLTGIRPAVVVCLTALHFLCVCTGFARTEALCTEDGGSQNFRTFVITECFADSAIVFGSVVWRHFSMLRIIHEIQASISQSESQASRSLLNIICDATVELDGRLQIMDETPRLASLLQHGCDRSLRGSSMLQFILEEDQQQFTQSIRSSSDECMANVFHTRVRDSISNVIRMEVFHVPVTSYLKADSHLIGVREYADVIKNVGSPSNTGGLKGCMTEGAQTAGDVAHPWNPSPTNAGPCGPPSCAWSKLSSSLPSSRGTPHSLSGMDGEIAVCIDVLSDSWSILSFTPGFELFCGSGSRTGRLFQGAREFRNCWGGSSPT